MKSQDSSRSGRRSRLALEWAGVVVLLVAVASAVGLDLRASHQAIEASERERLLHQVRVVERMLGTRLQATVNALDSLRADVRPLLAQVNGPSQLDERMRVMVASMAGVRTFLLVDARGVVVSSNRKELLGHDFHDGERYQAIRSRPDATTLYISPPFMTPLRNWALSLGRVVLDRQGAFDGYVLAVIDPEYFELLLDSARYAPDMAAAMIHGGGLVIYRVPDPQGVAGRNLAEKPDSAFSRHLRSGLDHSAWLANLTSSGREALVVLQDIRPSSSTSDGYLVASFSRETAALFAPWQREARDRGLALVAFGLAAILGLYFHQRRRADRARQEEARAALQARVAESQKLESIGRLAGGVAHDFNNLLTIILSSGGEARRDAKEGRPPDPEMIDDLMSAAERAAELTRQLLAFARKQVIAPVTLDVNEHLRSSQKLLGRVLGEDVWVVERLQADLWPVRCDPGLFGQIVLNLAVNARDAMPDGGAITVTTQNLTVFAGDPARAPALAPGDYVRLLVEDTGSGMTTEVTEHLFEPFFTTKGPGRGTGLGLATVYGIVKQSGAHIGVRSAPGKGTTFEICFPRHTGEARPLAPAVACGEGGSETILVVEDEPGVRAAITKGLCSGGYHVLTASGAEEALALARAAQGGLHLLLTDVVMPGKRGPELARRVMELCPGVRVLYMSGHTQDAFGRQGVLDADTDFISKPFTPDALRARVREALDRAPARPMG